MWNVAFLVSILVVPCALGESTSGRSVEEGTVYVPIGKRDPFKRPLASDGSSKDVSALNPLEKFPIDQFQLRAILRGTSTAQAMFEDPEGRVHILSEGTLLGRERGTISRILNREVIVTERTVNYLGVTSLFERVLSLPSDEEVDQAAPVLKGGNGPAGGGGSPGAGGGAAAPNAEKKIIRAVADERVAPARAAAPPAQPAQPQAGAENRNVSRVGGLTIGAPPPPAPPAAGAGSIRGGDGKGLTY